MFTKGQIIWPFFRYNPSILKLDVGLRLLYICIDKCMYNSYNHLGEITAEVDNKFWTIIVSDDLSTLVTVRRAHENEVQDAKED